MTVTVEDRARVEVPTAEPLIRFRISGPARIVGVDNGDQISHTSFQAHQVRLEVPRRGRSRLGTQGLGGRAGSPQCVAADEGSGDRNDDGRGGDGTG